MFWGHVVNCTNGEALSADLFSVRLVNTGLWLMLVKRMPLSGLLAELAPAKVQVPVPPMSPVTPSTSTAAPLMALIEEESR